MRREIPFLTRENPWIGHVYPVVKAGTIPGVDLWNVQPFSFSGDRDQNKVFYFICG